MKKTVSALLAGLTILLTVCTCSNQKFGGQAKIQTFCNPIDLSYRFRPDVLNDEYLMFASKASRREAADPTIVLFNDEYYMFVSKSGGYFHSDDLVHWDLIKPTDDFFPTENYAPTALVIDDAIYFITTDCDKVLKSSNPKSGKWEIVADNFMRTRDPSLFLDDDGRLYYYGEGGGDKPIFGVEIDCKTFKAIGEPIALISMNSEKYGWEVAGDYNTLVDKKGCIEGAWINKFGGKYYLQYASPGTELKSYNDAVYVADKPLGPYTLAKNNPFAYKHEGFVSGFGHGSTFADKYGNLWHAGTISISMRHIFERRLSLSPVFIDSDGEIYTCTGFGDYPMIMPDKKIASPTELFPKFMLLSYNKPVTVSSTLAINKNTDEAMKEWWLKASDFGGKNAVDEDIRTWWSAETGNNNEWLSIDLENSCEVHALQINFADQDAELFGFNDAVYYQYTVEESADGKNWKVLIDKSKNIIDAPHEYIQLENPIKTRYLKIKNTHVPSGKFSLSDFRIFGKSNKKAPTEVTGLVATRGADRRSVKLSWDKASDATGYNIRFGTKKDKLYQNYIVYGKNELNINSLNAEQTYFFAIDAFNEGGITQGKGGQAKIQTFCNPMDLSYRFRPEAPSRREAADPTIVLFNDEYYMFVSKSGGYFHSDDLVHWDLIKPIDDFFPLENYAPTALVIDDAIYFITSDYDKVLKSADPKSGKWEIVKDNFFKTRDPSLFLDDDGRLYYYGEGGEEKPILGVETDRKTFEAIGEPVALMNSCRAKYGWEVSGDYNTLVDKKTWIEGAWINKFGGKYYLQYASPGTEFKSYNDAVYVADKPLGPYTLAKNNPFAYKPEGFVSGFGHGSTFADKYGNLWHTGTISVSARHVYERRLSLSPVFIDSDGEIYTCTGFGDYPMVMPERKINSPDELFPNLMLLSYHKKAEASSVLSGYPTENAVDEEIRTWWSAETGNSNEWFSIDLENSCEVHALQINFADHDAELFARNDSIYYQYIVEESSDGKNWKVLIDKSQNTIDAPHEYIQLENPVKTRYLKIKNIHVPSGKFSLFDFRIFGKSDKKTPSEVSGLVATRDADRRSVKLSWNKAPDATGYNIRFGTKKDKLYQNYMIYDKNELNINSLNIEQTYFFAIDAFNEGGITRGKLKTICK